MTKRKDWPIYIYAIIGAIFYVAAIVGMFQAMHGDAIRTGVLK